MRIKIVTWNIAGGRKVKSSKRFDYENEALGYFSDNLKALDPDVICLQEVSFKDGTSSAKKIADRLGDYKIYDYELSPSHIDKDARMGIAILSKPGVIKNENIGLPYPDFDLSWKDGKKADRHDKGLQVIKTNDFFIANTHILPIGLFGYSYSEGRGRDLFSKFSDVILAKLERPIIFCGDFSGDFNGKFDEIFKDVSDKFSFKDALSGKVTRNIDSEITDKSKTDYIFYSPEFKLIRSDVVETETDHFLCFAEFETDGLLDKNELESKV